MNEFFTSQIRTYAPIIVGAIVSWLATKGFNLDANTSGALIITVTAVLQGAYYLAARLLERVSPKFGLLLGVAKQPVYARSETAYAVPDTAAGVVDNKVKENK